VKKERKKESAWPALGTSVTNGPKLPVGWVNVWIGGDILKPGRGKREEKRCSILGRDRALVLGGESNEGLERSRLGKCLYETKGKWCGGNKEIELRQKGGLEGNNVRLTGEGGRGKGKRKVNRRKKPG